jgi:hypothetical protein
MWNQGVPFQKRPATIANTHVALFEILITLITHPEEQHVTTASQSGCRARCAEHTNHQESLKAGRQ